MSDKVIPKHDKRGLLPPGFYSPTLEEFIERFVSVVNMEIRGDLFEKYSQFCNKCLDTGLLISHYVNGSYTTTKENPGDIDLLVILDGLKIDECPDELVDEYLDIDNSTKMKDEYSCHSFCALKYPVSDPLYNYHNSIKNQVISWWKLNFMDDERTILDPVSKGVIILSEDEISKIQS